MTDQLPAGYADTDIAVVGFAGRFPGAADAEQFWRNIRDGVVSATWLDDEALRKVGVSEELLAERDYVRAAYVVDDVEGFDARFFGFSPREAAIMDPQQRHFLEVAWTALEHAGYAPERLPGPAGVFAGCGASLYLMQNLLTNPDLVKDVGFFLLRHTGNDKDFLATRVSYLFNLSGPSINVQTACSTSLVAVHLACQSLLNSECDIAMAGGSTIRQPSHAGYVFKDGEIMSPDGYCRPFDAKARGTVFGSGSGAVILRRLADAVRDGDTIHAVIRGSAVNNDGSAKVGYLAPSVDGQASAIAEALAVADAAPDSVQFIECHGTATPVGDPIEVAALMQAYGADGVPTGSIAIGSVKGNIGHLDTAAGVAGLIKAVQALRHRALPPSAHYTAPNPAIPFEDGPFYVNAELRAWDVPDGGPRRAAVSALGAGGTNAHVVLQEAPAWQAPTRDEGAQLLVLSAKTPAALERRAADLAAFLGTTEGGLGDIAYTLQVGRQAFAHRRFVVAASAEDGAAQLTQEQRGQSGIVETGAAARSVAFMFTGMGSQYPAIGRDLHASEPQFREAVEACITLVQPLLDWDIRSLLFPAPGDEARAAAEMERPSRAMPCLFTIQYAMATLLRAWGIEPDAMIGHSMGEYTAAHLAGVFSLADALALVTKRGVLIESLAPGGMLVVPMTEAELLRRLPAGLSVAAVNAPELSVASGPVELLAAFEAALRAEGIEGRRVPIRMAGHSLAVEPILPEFEAFCRGIRFHKPNRPFVSNVSGTWITDADATDPRYWVRHLRATVRFADGVETLLQDDRRVLLEVGPGRTLSSMAGLHGARKPHQVAIPTMRRPGDEGDDRAVALAAVGRLWVAGGTLDWSRLHRGPRRRVPLPTYPFEHQPYFIRPGTAAAAAPSLARRADPADWFWRPEWQRSTPAAAPAAPVGDRWLVLHDQADVGAPVAAHLSGAGRDVVSVQPGRQFERVGARAFTVDPASRADLGRVVETLAGEGWVPQRVVHTWGAGAFGADETRLFLPLLELAQALATRVGRQRVRFDVVTRGGQLVAGEAAMDPARALVLGPVRVLPKEFGWLTARAIDLPVEGAPGGAPARALGSVLRELALGDDEPTVAWRGSERFVLRFTPTPLPAPEAARPLARDGEVVLITGGLGGIGLLVAESLAKAAKVRLVLTGRQARRTPALEALERLGAEVLPVAADVTDADAMARAVQAAHERFGPISTVIHAAGLIEDALAVMKDADSVRRVLAPKVAGTLVLDAATRGEPLERFFLFSSRGAYSGVAGQVDYTAASAFLDAWAQQRAALDGLPVLSIDWCAWEGIGVAALGVGLPPGRDTGHPLLGRCTRREGAEAEFRSVLAADTHWLLDEHRVTSGASVIPGTGYLEIMRAAVAAVDGPGAVALREVMFVTPFTVQANERREMRVRVTGSADEREVVVEGRPTGATAWMEHSRGGVVRAEAPPAPLDVAGAIGRCNTRVVEYTGTEQRITRLRLGARWSNLRRVAFGDGEAIAHLELPADFTAETSVYRMHPSLLDVATACAQALVPGFDPQKDFYVPVLYGSLVQHAPLTPSCLSHIRLRPGAGPSSDTAVYDVTVVAPDGRVLVDVREFTMMRMRDQAWGGRAAAESPAAERVEVKAPQAVGLTGAEGLEAFRRVAAAGIGGNVIVSPVHLPAYLASLRGPDEDDDEGSDAAGGGELVDTGQLEAVLATHEAVHQAVVVARRAADGAPARATAFVVWELGERATLEALRGFVASAMPPELTLESLVELTALPRDAAGSVDRQALAASLAGHADGMDELEARIHKLWSKKLGVERIGRDENFFELGGHSLLFTQTITRLRADLGVDVSLQAMFATPTIASVAAALRAAREAAAAGGGSAIPALVTERPAGPVPSSFAQWRLWFEDQLDPGRSMYNLPIALVLTGRLDVPALQRALAHVVERHEVLRTTLAEVDGQLAQHIHAAGTAAFEHVTCPSRAAAEELVAQEAARPFDLREGPLFRAVLASSGAEEHVLLLVAHHAMVDGYSMSILLGEVAAAYEAFAAGRTPAPAQVLQYGDFAIWQRKYVQGEVLQKQLQWWRQVLGGELPALALPADRPRPPVVEHVGDLAERYLPEDLQQRLNQVARAEGTSAFVLLLTAFEVLLGRLAAQSDVLVASPLANRNLPELEAAVGMYVNTVVVRTALDANASFREHLRRVKRHLGEIQEHQDAPFEQVVEALQPKRDPSRHPIFQAMFSWQPAPADRFTVAGLEARSLPVGGKRSPFDVWLDVQDGRRGARLALLYSVALFDPATADRMLAGFEALLRGVADDPDQPVGRLPVMEPKEREALLDGFNRTSLALPAGTTPQWIAARAAETPDVVAVRGPDGTRTYRALVEAAGRTAAALRQRGVREGDVVGVLMERSCRLVEVLLGVWQAGAAYLPLDPAHPAERLEYILADAGAAVLVEDEAGEAADVETDVPRALASSLVADASAESLAVPRVEALAYVIYTSGSTGRPKGVEIPHGALANFLEGMRVLLEVDGSVRALALTTPSFDIFGLECWLPLVVGGTTVMATDDAQLDGGTLRDAIESNGVTLVQATPTTWRLLLGAGWDGRGVRYALAGGENVPKDLAAALASRVPEAWNVYGPTETTIWSTAGRLRESGVVSIGRPIANTTVYVMDANSQPCPIGASGELWIGGLGVARGYRGRPDLTADRFIADPFAPGGRCYRTGDLARWLPDGTLECLGRKDGQVKVRGFRIELEEVEHVLQEHDAVRQAVAAVRPDPTGTATLVAFLVRDPAVAVTGSELRRHCRKRLPDYMVPSLIVDVDAIPLTPNGKVDRKMLPDPFAAAKVEAEAAGDPPDGPTEIAIAGIWQALLGISRVERRDSFFDLGGHSLLAMRMKAQLEQQFGLPRLPAAIIFRTLEQLAVEVEQAAGVAS